MLAISAGLISKSQTTLTEKELAAYGNAGAVAEEALSAVRTVVSFGGRAKEVDRYETKLVFARKASILRGAITGLGIGSTWAIIFASYGLAFWYGVKLVMDDREECFEDLEAGKTECDINYDSSKLLNVFFSVLMGAMQVGQSGIYVEAFAQAQASAAKIFDVIDRVPPIDSSSKDGESPKEKAGNFSFKDCLL